ncbi:MAG: hypothetical protein K2N71_10885, partial [Oscillospiraceae bacterium]|nr:hypothetical protein [Oscillospiraceae bacterium]
MSFFFGESSAKPVVKPKNKIVRNEDTFVSSKRTKTIHMINIAEIDKIINSGEPLRGVSFEEYCVYHSLKNNIHDPKREYIQALKGDKASLREREWRTNPNYRIPERLYNSPEVTADREAVLEKLRRGEDVSGWESSILKTFSNAYEGNLIENEARNEGARVRLQNKVTSALSEAGIELSEDDELQFEVWGYDMIAVTGNISDDKLELVKETFADNALGFQYIYQISGHSDEAKAGGLALVYLQSAEKFLKEAGGGSVFDIGKDADGNFTGLPGDLGEFIKKNAVGTFGIGSEVYKSREEDSQKALYMREPFN